MTRNFTPVYSFSTTSFIFSPTSRSYIKSTHSYSRGKKILTQEPLKKQVFDKVLYTLTSVRDNLYSLLSGQVSLYECTTEVKPWTTKYWIARKHDFDGKNISLADGDACAVE